MVFLVCSPIAEITNEVRAKPSVRAGLFQAFQTRGLTKVVSVVRNPALGDTPAAVRQFSNEEHLEGRILLERNHGDLLHCHRKDLRVHRSLAAAIRESQAPRTLSILASGSIRQAFRSAERLFPYCVACSKA